WNTKAKRKTVGSCWGEITGEGAGSREWGFFLKVSFRIKTAYSLKGYYIYRKINITILYA
ncbi:MAG: hypothetical protein WAK10_08790, partial [Methanoregula sp.]